MQTIQCVSKGYNKKLRHLSRTQIICVGALHVMINDPEMRKRLLELNPHSFRRIVGTLLEVNGRGYWETSDENIQQLQELYQEVEDRIEGVKSDG